MTFRHKPRPNTPLGQLIAGEISQAEYRRLLRAQAHRDDELERRPPTGPQDYARLGRHVVAPEPARPTSTSPDRPRFPLLTWSLFVAIVAIALVAFLIANRSAAPRSAPDPTATPAARDVSELARGASGPEPSGAPHDEAIPRTRGIEPATTPDPAHQAAVGAPQNLHPRVGREGDIAHSGSRSPYVAIPLGPGIRIRVCGPADCITVTSTDAGPNRASLLAGRIMDLDIGRWERVCGMPARFGLCPGSWVRVGASSPTLPPTDVVR
jgi:hypothetical protein